VLLCYGKLEAMKDLIPDRPRSTRKVRKLPTTPVTEGVTA